MVRANSGSSSDSKKTHCGNLCQVIIWQEACRLEEGMHRACSKRHRGGTTSDTLLRVVLVQRRHAAVPSALNSVDYAASGEPIGWEITALHQVTIAQVNAVLTRLGLAAMAPEKLAPLHAA